MNILAAILLALTAGITELLPVSGSGHIFILAKLLGIDAGSDEFRIFRAMLCFGAAFAAILFYRTQLSDMVRENLTLLGLLRPSRQRGEPFGRRLGFLLLFAAAPMLAALLLNPLRLQVEQSAYALAIISVLLAVTGVVVFFTARGAKGARTIHQSTLSDVLWTGLVQVLSVFPGLSRCGLTASVLMGRGLDGPAAAELSGLMAVPVFLAAGFLQLGAAGSAEIGSDFIPYLVLGFSLSAVAGFFTLRYFTEQMSRRRPTGCAYWCWGAAIFAMILFLISA